MEKKSVVVLGIFLLGIFVISVLALSGVDARSCNGDSYRKGAEGHRCFANAPGGGWIANGNTCSWSCNDYIYGAPYCGTDNLGRRTKRTATSCAGQEQSGTDNSGCNYGSSVVEFYPTHDVNCAPACIINDSLWTPSPSTVCEGLRFTQTSNCGNTREANGTKFCPLGPGIPPSNIYENLTAYWTLDTQHGSTDFIAVDVWADNNGTVEDGVVAGNVQISDGLVGESYELESNEFINISSLSNLSVSSSYWLKMSGFWSLYVNSNGTYYKNRDVISVSEFIDAFSLQDNLLIGIGQTLLIDEIALWERELGPEDIDVIINETINRTGEDPAVCGDGVIALTEQCDDGNLNNNDCCLNICEFNTGYAGITKTNSTGTSVCYAHQCSLLGNDFKSCSDVTKLNTTTCLNTTSGGLSGVWKYSSSLTDCAPETCEYGVGGNAQCSQTVNNQTIVISFCEDYGNESDCQNADQAVCDASVNLYLEGEDILDYQPENIPSIGFCDTNWPLNVAPVPNATLGTCNYFATNCSCGWNSTTCGSSYDQVRICDKNGTITNEVGTCSFSSTSVINNCNTTGYITYSRVANWVGGYQPLESTCESYTRDYRCVETIQMDFFDIKELLFAVLIIFGCYLMFHKK
jgi:cysteine-rich repeat protein